MLNVLLADGSLVFAKLLKRRLERDQRYHLVHAMDDGQLQQILATGHEFLLALVEFSLPGSGDGHGIRQLIAKKIPVVVLASAFDNDADFSIRQDDGIVDYVTKKTMNLDYIVEIIARMEHNGDHPILVAFASPEQANTISEPLKRYRFPIFEAHDEPEALQILTAHPEIRLVLIDYAVPGCDGLKLLEWIRQDLKRNRDDLLVVGVSAQGEEASVRFIKEGANDFLAKPFHREELIYRVHQNIQRIENQQTLNAITCTDSVTQLANARFFLNAGVALYSNAIRENISVTLAVFAIDEVASLVENYGDYARVLALMRIGALLNRAFRKTDIAARLDDETFGVLIANPEPDNTVVVFSRLKQRIEALRIPYEDDFIRVKVSIGITSRLVGSLADMVAHAMTILRQVQQEGGGIRLG
ncbi:MAG: response regulator [Magnetococcus sp. THC-1_WYH]